MRIARVEIRNWRCFRGEHVVGLGPGAHAVIARHEKDHERSNWIGKSSFLWAILFAATGALPEDCRAADDWITRGEKDGAVAVVLDDGTRIERTRARGGPTVCEVVEPSGARHRKAEAETRIAEIIGLSADDAVVWFLAQKTMDRFVRARPADRAREVAGWLGLEPLVRAEQRARVRLSEIADEETRLAAEETARRSALAALLARAGLPESTAPDEARRSIEERRNRAVDFSHRCENEVARLAAADRALVEHRANERRRREREELRRHAEQAEREARRAANASPPAARLERLRLEHEHAETAAREAERKARDGRVLARGEFDGRCPVGNVACPISAELNARWRENDAAAREAAENARGARERADAARRALDAAAGLLRAAETARARADALGGRAARLEDADEPGEPEPEDVSEELRRAREEAARARDEIRDAERDLAELRRLTIEQAAREKRLAEIRARAATAREAVRILGRRGAQRRIAEQALSEIEAGANDLLARSGIALTIRVSWEREAKGLAATCDECGAPFPASTRVRECARCRAERGPRIDEKLDVELSDRSGAAEDLAGVALSLAASLRIRSEKGSAWGLVCLDEPFGALDRAHRRALARGLVAMLAGRWEQALVIAHDEGVMDGMPGRVVILGGEAGSRIERA